MEIRGIGFVGSHTPAHAEMEAFVQNVLGLRPITVAGVGATLFAATNGDVLAVARPYEEDGTAERTIGLLVDDVDAAAAELHAAGDRDRRDLRERPLALHPLPRTGREAVRARRGARRA